VDWRGGAKFPPSAKAMPGNVSGLPSDTRPKERRLRRETIGFLLFHRAARPEPKASAAYFNETSVSPVISGGWGRPIIVSSVGATSFSAPPDASFAGRPT
jgi:hypothetical protein